MNTIKAIVVNPIEKSVTLVDMPADFDTMKRDYIKCDMAEVMDFGEGVDAWFDEEGTLKDWDSVGFTSFVGQPFAGNIVLCGRDANNDMADIPSHIDVEFVSNFAKFIPPQEVRIPGPVMVTENEDGSRTVTRLGPDRTYKRQQG